MDHNHANVLADLVHDVRDISARVADMDRRFKDASMRISDVEVAQGDDDSFKMISLRVSTLEEILGRIGGVHRAVRHEAAEADAQLVGRRRSRRDSADLADPQAERAVEAAEVRTLEANVRGADVFFSNLGRRLAHVEVGVVQVRTDLESAVRRLEVATRSEVAALQDAVRGFWPVHRVLEERLRSAEASLGQLSRGQGAPGGLPGKASELNLRVEELRDKVRCLDKDLQGFVAPVKHHDANIGGIEVELHSIGLRLNAAEARCEDLTQKVTEVDGLRQALCSVQGRSRWWFQRPRWFDIMGRTPVEDTEAPKEGAHLSAKVRDLEEMLKRLDRRFSGFVAELNCFGT